MKIALLASNQWNNYVGLTTDEGHVMRIISDVAADGLRRAGVNARVFWEMHSPRTQIAELREMCRQVNAWGPDYTVSPHSDAVGSPQRDGILMLLSDVYGRGYQKWALRLGMEMGTRSGLGFKGLWYDGRQGPVGRSLLALSSASSRVHGPFAIMEIGEHKTAPEAAYLASHTASLGRALAASILASLGLEDDMPIDNVALETARASHLELRKAGILNQVHRVEDAAGVGLLCVVVDRAMKMLQAETAVLREEVERLKAGTPPPGSGTAEPGELTLATPLRGTWNGNEFELMRRVPKAVYPPAVVRDICVAYLRWCAAFGLDCRILFAQMLLETAGLKFGGDVKPEQYNFAVIGATGGVPGNSFATPELGVIAHVAHMAWYVFPDHVRPECSLKYDPRHFGSKHHGGVTVLGDLGNGRWTHAKDYAARIMRCWNRGV